MREFVKAPVELRIYGVDVKLTRPTFGQGKRLQAAAKAGSDNLEAVEQVLIECGLPKDLLEQMEAQHVSELQQILLEPKKN